METELQRYARELASFEVWARALARRPMVTPVESAAVHSLIRYIISAREMATGPRPRVRELRRRREKIEAISWALQWKALKK